MIFLTTNTVSTAPSGRGSCASSGRMIEQSGNRIYNNFFSGMPDFKRNAIKSRLAHRDVNKNLEDNEPYWSNDKNLGTSSNYDDA